MFLHQKDMDRTRLQTDRRTDGRLYEGDIVRLFWPSGTIKKVPQNFSKFVHFWSPILIIFLFLWSPTRFWTYLVGQICVCDGHLHKISSSLILDFNFGTSQVFTIWHNVASLIRCSEHLENFPLCYEIGFYCW